MASSPYLTDRVMGMWGPRAYAWTGEAPPRVLGIPYDLSGHQRELEFPPDPPRPQSHHWLRALAHRHPHWPGRGPQPGAS
jgi:hypothetical protein